MRHSRANPLIAVKNDSTILSDLEVVSLIPSLQRQVTEHFQPAWGIGAQIVFAEKRVPRHAYQILIVDEAASVDDAGYMGYHFQSDGSPLATIFAKDDMKDDGTISDTMSHEILEMLVDPAVNLYAYRPAGRGRRERGYFYEVCDAVQCEHYKIDGVMVCDFVYPEWYEHNWPPRSRRFDHLGKVEEPFQVLPGCYADVREVGVGWRTIWGSTKRKKRGRHRLKTRLEERNLP
jgi:hypothetical protein